jgi:hypothetical protein
MHHHAILVALHHHQAANNTKRSHYQVSATRTASCFIYFEDGVFLVSFIDFTAIN